MALCQSAVNNGYTNYGYNGDETISIDAYTMFGGSPTQVMNYSYGYDEDGRLATFDNGSTTTSFAYDGANELTQTVAGSTTQTYTYDYASNRMGSGITIGANNELLNESGVTYGYDPAGNMTSTYDSSSGNTWSYGYNANNQMTSAVETNGGTTLESVSYTYDVFGNRYSEAVTVGATVTTTDFIYVPNGGLYATFASSAIQTRYVADVQGENYWEAQVTNAGAQWLLSDYQGSVMEVVGASGVMASTSYDAFGNGTTVCLVGFQGMPYDSVIQQYFATARPYNPATGRFDRIDPDGFPAGQSNLYVGMGNAPTDGKDPSGTHLVFANAIQQKAFQKMLASNGIKAGEGAYNGQMWNGTKPVLVVASPKSVRGTEFAWAEPYLANDQLNCAVWFEKDGRYVRNDGQKFPPDSVSDANDAATATAGHYEDGSKKVLELLHQMVTERVKADDNAEALLSNIPALEKSTKESGNDYRTKEIPVLEKQLREAQTSVEELDSIIVTFPRYVLEESYRALSDKREKSVIEKAIRQQKQDEMGNAFGSAAERNARAGGLLSERIKEEGEAEIRRMQVVASVGVGLIPVVSNVVGVYEAASGHDIFGNELTTGQRIVIGVASVLPILAYSVKGLAPLLESVSVEGEVVAKELRVANAQVLKAAKTGEGAAEAQANLEKVILKAKKVLPPGKVLIRQVAATGKAVTSCFAAGTPLLTPNGSKAIEKLKPGDLVFSRPQDDYEGKVEAKRVEEVFVRLGRIWHLHVGGKLIRTTGEHPFWTRRGNWASVAELNCGDELLGHDGQWVVVDDLLDKNEYETVYNVRVAVFHTYFVGCEEWGFSVWAHNTDECVKAIINNLKPVAGKEEVVTQAVEKAIANPKITKAEFEAELKGGRGVLEPKAGAGTTTQADRIEGAWRGIEEQRSLRIPKTAQEAIAQAKKNTGNYALYKFEELESNPGILRSNERVLDLPDRPITWAENEAGLQNAMNEGLPIRDASPTKTGGYLQKEREYLIQKGWKFDPETGFWNPPRK